MYLNRIMRDLIGTNIGLTVTLDVFKFTLPPYVHSKYLGLTVTLDVFKFYKEKNTLLKKH